MSWPAAVLFDLDGTLVDTERQSADAMAIALAAGQDVEVDADDKLFIVGRSWVAIHERLRLRYPALRWSVEQLAAATADARERLLGDGGLTPLPGAVATVRRFPRRALVTGSSRREASHALELIGLGDAFPLMMASEDVARSKPAPDGYQQAARGLGVDPAACLVFEDSVAGIAAARAAGCLVVAVRAGNFAGHDQAGADHIVDSLEAVDDELLRWLAGRAAGR
ncbi:MAG: HAD family phosphatase [Kofleriaceae bacterium]|jgi:sugar-phosphatase|nr:HAD family phosphatase [Kofleriaceae bacterium]MBP6838313.1 HAD family phosphatase [Kofleriaceae bacterium]MBP9203973.1 HAD family phosphatase [Kofleriaceae bacterium]